jgi:hypothetical protein
MPNISVQFRRGTDTEHSSFTGAVGEVTVDTTNDTLRVHDGSTAGGVRLAKLSEAGGSGTVTSVDSGTGLTGGPITTSGTLSIADNGVTFAKMQDINTAKVIGRTTAGSGDPEEVSILDEDAMTSNSATALATQQSIKAYVDAQTVSKYTSSWFNDTTGLANGGTYSFSHTLGTAEAQVQVWMATSSAGAGIKLCQADSRDGTGSSVFDTGLMITNITSSTIEVQLAASGWQYYNSSGARVGGNWGTTYTHIKVVAIG